MMQPVEKEVLSVVVEAPKTKVLVMVVVVVVAAAAVE